MTKNKIFGIRPQITKNWDEKLKIGLYYFVRNLFTIPKLSVFVLALLVIGFYTFEGKKLNVYSNSEKLNMHLYIYIYIYIYIYKYMHFVILTFLILRTLSLAVISELFVSFNCWSPFFMQFSMLWRHCHCYGVTEFHSDRLGTGNLDVKSNNKHI